MEDGGPASASRSVRPRGPVLTVGVLLGVLAVSWGWLVGLRPLGDNSFLTHLATGRLIVAGGIPRRDPYTWTAAGDPWVVQSWLVSWALGWLDRLGGLDAVRLARAAVTALLAGLAWWTTAGARSVVVRLAVGGAVLVSGAAFWTERPLLVGLAAVAAVLVALDGRLPPVVLAPVGWVWVNSHGSYPLGLVLVAAHLVGTRMDGDRHAAARSRRTAAWLAAGVAAGAVNPLGPRLLWFPATVATRSESFRLVREWQAPRFEDPAERIVLGLVAVALLALVRRPSWSRGLPLVVFAAAGSLAARNLAVTALVAGWVAAGGFGDLGRLRTARALRAVPGGLAVGLVGVLAVTGSVALVRQPPLNVDGYPVGAVEVGRRLGIVGPGARLVHQDVVGNYLELVGAGPVFIDDRVDMLPVDLVEDYRTLLAGRAGWDEILDRWNPTAVLWESDAPLGQLLALSPRWRLVVSVDGWSLFRPA